MSLFDDCNKTELTKEITAAACQWLDERGCKPVETEVCIERKWIADIATAVSPTETELQMLKLIPRKPSWKKSKEELAAWEEQANTVPDLMTVIVEVKASMQDLTRDEKWIRPRPANLCYLAVPQNIPWRKCQPEGWGILEYRKDRFLQHRTPVLTTVTTEMQRDVIYAIAMRRDNQTRYEHLRRLQRDERERSNQTKSLTRMQLALRLAISLARGEHPSVAAALEHHGMRNLSKWEIESLENLLKPSETRVFPA